jgi:hypothetical protein
MAYNFRPIVTRPKIRYVKPFVVASDSLSSAELNYTVANDEKACGPPTLNRIFQRRPTR